MTERPTFVPFGELRAGLPADAQIWASPSLAPAVCAELARVFVPSPSRPKTGVPYLLVVGGGRLIDQAKLWRKQESPKTVLAAVPSLWGSGAENSPVAVLGEGGEKKIFMGADLLPDVRSIWPELARTIPAPLARYACGDVWAHALEAFLSPLGDEAHRAAAGGLIRRLCELPIANDPAWFEPGAQACALQARTSVGLIHGLAHALEGPLHLAYPEVYAGHARLCATFLLPVFRFNRAASSKVDSYSAKAGIDLARVEERLRELFEPEFYSWLAPHVQQRWMDIIRQPLSRLNSALVRPDSLEFFRGFSA